MRTSHAATAALRCRPRDRPRHVVRCGFPPGNSRGGCLRHPTSPTRSAPGRPARWARPRRGAWLRQQPAGAEAAGCRRLRPVAAVRPPASLRTVFGDGARACTASSPSRARRRSRNCSQPRYCCGRSSNSSRCCGVKGSRASRRTACTGGGQLQLFETAAGQFEEHGRLAFGAEQADRDLAVGAPVMLQMRGEALHAAVASGEKGGEIGAQPSGKSGAWCDSTSKLSSMRRSKVSGGR